MLKPLVMYPSLSVTVTEQQDEGIILALQCLEESHEEKSTPSQVYSKLLLVLKTLHAHLLGTVWLGLWFTSSTWVMSQIRWTIFITQVYLKLSVAERWAWENKSRVGYFSDVSISDKKLSAILGELIWEEISQCIIHECLLYSIPNNSSQLEKYNTVWT